MAHIDCLSRSPMTINLVTVEDELLFKQLTNPKLKVSQKIKIVRQEVFRIN